METSEGQFVRQGARIGSCGNSGRSFTPHVHFQMQSTPRVGAPTREIELYDLVVENPEGEAPARLHRHHLPLEGEHLRRLDSREEVASLFSLRIGSTLRLRSELQDLATGRLSRVREESCTVHIDLYNNLYLESERGDRLFFENQSRQFILYDYQGRRDSALHVLYAAALRVPYELAGAVIWDDVLPLRMFRPRFTGWLFDLVDAFLPTEGVRMAFHAGTNPHGQLEVKGEGRLGRGLIETRACFGRRGPERFSVQVRGRLHKVTLLEEEHAS